VLPPLHFRRLARSDFGDLATWLAEPEVRRWWRDDPGPEGLEAMYGPSIDGGDPTEVFVIEVDGEPSGIVQRYRIADYADWDATILHAVPVLAGTPTAGIDYLLGRPQVRHRGIGTKVIEVFTATLFEDLRDVAAVVVTVQQANRPSWRALERAGYRRVWAGELASEDPSDDGPEYILVRHR
jgi:aminoglycoside 6'-N-acetyltransferase